MIQYGFLCRVTVDGYVAIERIKTERKPDQCFVAIWFSEETDALYDNGIAPAVEAAGYKPIRIDRETNFIGKIDDQIISEIRQSRFVIADFTHDERGAPWLRVLRSRIRSRSGHTGVIHLPGRPNRGTAL